MSISAVRLIATCGTSSLPPPRPDFFPPNAPDFPRLMRVLLLDRRGDDDLSEEQTFVNAAARVLVHPLARRVHGLHHFVVLDRRLGDEDHRLRLRILGLHAKEMLGELVVV